MPTKKAVTTSLSDDLEVLLKNLLLHLANPDVAEADRLARVTVHLQTDRTIAVRAYLRMTDVLCCTTNSEVVEQYDAVLDNRYGRRYLVSTVCVEYGSAVDDIVNVPLAGLTHSVCQRNNLLVDATCLTVGVGLVVVAIQHLNLVDALQEDTAVTTSLT